VPTTSIVETGGVRSTAVTFSEQTGLALPPLVRDRSARIGGDSGAVTAPIPGNVLQLTVKEGQPVRAGDIVVILEAMKMENEIAAAIDGIISAVAVAQGDAVAAGQLLVAIEATE